MHNVEGGVELFIAHFGTVEASAVPAAGPLAVLVLGKTFTDPLCLNFCSSVYRHLILCCLRAAIWSPAQILLFLEALCRSVLDKEQDFAVEWSHSFSVCLE